jgi:hypothetical protein
MNKKDLILVIVASSVNAKASMQALYLFEGRKNKKLHILYSHFSVTRSTGSDEEFFLFCVVCCL